MRLGAFCSSFVEIQTFDGLKWIKDLKVGDLVLTNERRYKKVINIHKSEIPKDCFDEMYDLYFYIEDQNGTVSEEGLYRVHEDLYIKCINGFKSIKDIKVGDLLLCKDLTKVRINSIVKTKIRESSRYIYSFEIEKDCTFYANNVCVKR